MSLSFTMRNSWRDDGKHLHKIADFYIGAENAIAHDQLNVSVGILSLQSTHDFDSGIGEITDSEDNLKFRIVLFAVAAKALPYFGIYAFQRFEDRDWWELVVGELFFLD